jgi:hypothetical protein
MARSNGYVTLDETGLNQDGIANASLTGRHVVQTELAGSCVHYGGSSELLRYAPAFIHDLTLYLTLSRRRPETGRVPFE